MVQAKFDPALALKFDLGRGTVSQVGAGARLVLPAELVSKLLEGASAEIVRDAGHQLGTELGRKVLQAVERIDQAAPELVLEFLGGELALVGLGSLSFERWGKALVFSLDGMPLAGGDAFAAAVFDGALLRIFGKPTRTVCLVREGGRARYLVSGERAAERVSAWLQAGASWGEVLTRLDAEAGGPA